MSSEASISAQPPFPRDMPRRHDAPRIRSYSAQILTETFSSWRARIGALWIGILVFAAVFGPFLANSHPIALKMDGHWSSPLLQHLSPVDYILLIAFASGLILLFASRLRARIRFLIFFVIVLLSVPLLFVLSSVFNFPSKNIVYEQYREWTVDGRIERAFYAPIPYSAGDRLRDQPGRRLKPPNAAHWLGTESNGADVLSRMLHAARIALAIGLIATGIAVIVGIIIGGLMGYYSGKVDLIGMRLIEVFEAIPTLFLLLAFIAFFPRNLYVMMAIIGLTTWTGNARFLRAEFLRLRKQDFVHAAVAMGLPLRSILFRHMLPNGITPVLITASFGIASAILYESTLSFLGLGLVDEPSWGQLLNQSLSVGGTFIWWIAVFPGLAIFLTVFAYNLVGEALRDALDPRLRRNE